MDDFDLSDFLSQAVGGYTAYQTSQNIADANQTAAANRAAQLAALQGQNAMTAQTKTYLVIGGGILIAILAIILVFRRR